MAYLVDKNETAAGKLFERVKAMTEGLARRPVGRPDYAEGTLEKLVSRTSYLLVFELAGDELRILRMFHVSQDWRGWRDGEPGPQ